MNIVILLKHRGNFTLKYLRKPKQIKESSKKVSKTTTKKNEVISR